MWTTNSHAGRLLAYDCDTYYGFLEICASFWGFVPRGVIPIATCDLPSSVSVCGCVVSGLQVNTIGGRKKARKEGRKGLSFLTLFET